MRILINDTNSEAVRKALDNLRPNSDFQGDRDAAVAETFANKLTGKSATITKYESKKQSSKPPVGYSFPKLQMITSKKYDISPAKTLEICQKLYEQGILTYPRSDCEFLPENHQDEALIFELVAKRYISFFMPDFEFLQVSINADIDGEKNNSVSLLETSEGENCSCSYVNILEKTTKAPARFTEATLLKAMNEVYLYVQDPEIKKILKETDGIGTVATQAGIIQDLIDSGMLIKKGKNLISSQAANSLINALTLQPFGKLTSEKSRLKKCKLMNLSTIMLQTK